MDRVIPLLVCCCMFALGILLGFGLFSDTLNSNRWRNCDSDPPNFSGICCRWFEDDQRWECRRHTGDKGFSEADEALVPWLEGLDPETQEMEG